MPKLDLQANVPGFGGKPIRSGTLKRKVSSSKQDDDRTKREKSSKKAKLEDRHVTRVKTEGTDRKGKVSSPGRKETPRTAASVASQIDTKPQIEEESKKGTSLTDLPIELLYDIHLLSLSSALPYVNRFTFTYLSNPTSYRAAKWLMEYYTNAGPEELVKKALRHAICDLECLNLIETMWIRKAQVWESAHNNESSGTVQGVDQTNNIPLSLNNPYLPLTCNELPRRVARTVPSVPSSGPSTSLPIPSLIVHILDYYTPDPKSLNYGLCRAVMAGHEPAVRLFLLNGADPSLKEGLALELAITRKDLTIVKLLVDEENEHVYAQRVVKGGSRRRRGKMDIPPRVMNKVVNCGNREIVDYLVKEKGFMPSLGAIMALR